MFRLADDLAVEAAQRRFAETGRAQLGPFLAPADAEALRDELLAEQAWREVFALGDKLYEIARGDQGSIPADARRTIDDAISERARTGFQYRYESLRVPDEVAERAAMPGLLARFAEFMASAGVLDLLRSMTGARDIDFADAQATWYRSGDFLTAHHDAVEGKGRRVAYVFGLTPVWRPEWGGLLLFHDAQGDVAAGLTPRMNTLNLFAVPQEHSVSQVASYVTEPRLGVTGWLRARRAQGDPSPKQ